MPTSVSLWHKRATVSSIMIQPIRAQSRGFSTNESGPAWLWCAWENNLQLMGSAVAVGETLSWLKITSLKYDSCNSHVLTFNWLYPHGLILESPFFSGILSTIKCLFNWFNWLPCQEKLRIKEILTHYPTTSVYLLYWNTFNRTRHL